MRWLRLGFLLILIAWPAAATDERSLLKIETDKGPRVFTVEVVDTPATRAQGLMHREFLPQDHGMLFDFKVDRQVSFWMRNTLIPLDMIFADARGRILQIHENAIPGDETPILSDQPVRAVLEINGGLARFLGIRVGDRLEHFIFDGIR
jgi:hypothetical protein